MLIDRDVLKKNHWHARDESLVTRSFEIPLLRKKKWSKCVCVIWNGATNQNIYLGSLSAIHFSIQTQYMWRNDAKILFLVHFFWSIVFKFPFCAQQRRDEPLKCRAFRGNFVLWASGTELCKWTSERKSCNNSMVVRRSWNLRSSVSYASQQDATDLLFLFHQVDPTLSTHLERTY